MSRPASVLEWSPGAAGPLFAETRPDLSWRDAADCQYTDPEAFFPGKGESVKAAKRICAGCPVSTECLEYALENHIRDGIWGGMSERQRRSLVPDQPAAPRVRKCRKQLHVLDETNTGESGRCLACQRASDARTREAQRVARTGSSSPQSGRRLAA